LPRTDQAFVMLRTNGSQTPVCKDLHELVLTHWKIAWRLPTIVRLLIPARVMDGSSDCHAVAGAAGRLGRRICRCAPGLSGGAGRVDDRHPDRPGHARAAG